MARRDPKPFAPKPFKPGSTFYLDGIEYTVWSDGPVAASVWAQDEAGAFVAIKKPTPSRPAFILDYDGASRWATAEAIRTRGYLVVETFPGGWDSYNRQPRTFTRSTLHVDPECATPHPERRVPATSTEREELTPGRRYWIASHALKEGKPEPYGADWCACTRNPGRVELAAA
jgi:hypothetical protein